MPSSLVSYGLGPRMSIGFGERVLLFRPLDEDLILSAMRVNLLPMFSLMLRPLRWPEAETAAPLAGSGGLMGSGCV